MDKPFDQFTSSEIAAHPRAYAKQIAKHWENKKGFSHDTQHAVLEQVKRLPLDLKPKELLELFLNLTRIQEQEGQTFVSSKRAEYEQAGTEPEPNATHSAVAPPLIQALCAIQTFLNSAVYYEQSCEPPIRDYLQKAMTMGIIAGSYSHSGNSNISVDMPEVIQFALESRAAGDSAEVDFDQTDELCKAIKDKQLAAVRNIKPRLLARSPAGFVKRFMEAIYTGCKAYGGIDIMDENGVDIDPKIRIANFIAPQIGSPPEVANGIISEAAERFGEQFGQLTYKHVLEAVKAVNAEYQRMCETKNGHTDPIELMALEGTIRWLGYMTDKHFQAVRTLKNRYENSAAGFEQMLEDLVEKRPPPPAEGQSWGRSDPG